MSLINNNLNFNWDFSLENIANGFRSGYGNVKYLESNQNSTNYYFTFCQTAWKLGKVACKADTIFCILNNGMKIHRQAIIIGTVSLMTFNLINLLSGEKKIVGHWHNETYVLPERGIFATVWKLTPRLIVLTSIALTVIEGLYINSAKAVVAFSAMITTFDLRDKLDSTASKVLNEIIPPVAACISFFYGSNAKRAIIATETIVQYAL